MVDQTLCSTRFRFMKMAGGLHEGATSAFDALKMMRFKGIYSSGVHASIRARMYTGPASRNLRARSPSWSSAKTENSLENNTKSVQSFCVCFVFDVAMGRVPAIVDA